MDTTALHTLFSRVDAYRNDLIQLQTKLTAIPALGPDNEGEGEKNKADYIKKVLEKISPDILEEINSVTEDLKQKLGKNADLWQSDSRIH